MFKRCFYHSIRYNSIGHKEIVQSDTYELFN